MSDNIITVPPGEPHFIIERLFEAPRTLVYRCYTEPRHLARFWGPRGSTLTECRIDLRIGGVWWVRWQTSDGASYGYASVYLEIVPQVRLHYRDAPSDWVFGLEGLPPIELDSTIALEDRGRSTLVTVTVRCRSVAERDENVQRGFTHMVSVGNDRLAEYLSTIDLSEV